jgi:hypothetical protein
MARLRLMAGLFSLITMFLFFCSGCYVEGEGRDRHYRDRYRGERREDRRDWDRRYRYQEESTWWWEDGAVERSPIAGTL